MNQIDLTLLAFVLCGGWLGAVKGSTKAFVGLSGTILGLALAGLYGSRLVSLWNNILSVAATRVSLQLPWVSEVSTQSAWRQSAYSWLNDLLWPNSLKQWIAVTWGKLPPGETIAAWWKVIERGFFFALANVCAFITVLVLTKAIVSFVCSASFRFALFEKQSLSPIGFIVGLLQSSLLVIVILALLVPFFLWIGQVPFAQMLQPSLAFRAVEWLWSSILRT